MMQHTISKYKFQYNYINFKDGSYSKFNIEKIKHRCYINHKRKHIKNRYKLYIYNNAKEYEKVNVLVIGNGGREHALTWKLSQSMLCNKLYCSPGNAGISQENNVLCESNLDINNHNEIKEYCKNKNIDIVIIGPETPLVNGITDELNSSGIMTFGPSKLASQLEGSKSFMKKICQKYNISTAKYKNFKNAENAIKYVESIEINDNNPIVLKADGLAAGKGVIICNNVNESRNVINDILIHNKFDKAGSSIIIEEYLNGEEVSYFALVNGEDVIPLSSAQDHKKVGEGDKGLNTGGMGAYSPAPIITKEIESKILNNIIRPTAKAMVLEGMPFKGILFAGLMIIKDQIMLLEYNVRFGDPECQCLMLRLQSDLLNVILRTCKGELIEKEDIIWSSDTSITVIMAANGYPDKYKKGSLINGLDKIKQAKVFHSGTSFNPNGDLTASGGRVLGISALGKDIKKARELVYNEINNIEWNDGFCRRDIGWRALSQFTNI